MTKHGRISDQVGLKPTWTENHLCVLNDDDVVHLLRAAVKREGSQSAVAKRYGVDRGTMNSILNGKRRVGATVLKAFGLRKVYVIDDYRALSGLGVSDLSHDASSERPLLQGTATKEAGR
jgi:transcriptional regulator with XRE-family HTH domain